jgi:hypothetical protein
VRIAYFVHGNGRGHAMRARSLVPALRSRGHTVEVYASDDAVAMLRDLGVIEVDDFAPGPGLARRFTARFLADRALLRAVRPDVVVTDGDAPSLHAAVCVCIPSIAIGHGLLFAHCHLPISLPLHKRIREAVNAGSASWLANRVIVVHFGMLEPFDRRVIVARPDPRAELFEGDSPRTDALAVYGGQSDLSAYVRELHARGHELAVFGRVSDPPEGVMVEAPDVARFAAALRACRGIVGTAGSLLVAEAGALGLPLLALAPSHMIEQQVNARLVENDGLAIAAAAEEVDISAIERFEALLARGVPKIELKTPTVTEALLACLAELERPV